MFKINPFVITGEWILLDSAIGEDINYSYNQDLLISPPHLDRDITALEFKYSMYSVTGVDHIDGPYDDYRDKCKGIIM